MRPQAQWRRSRAGILVPGGSDWENAVNFLSPTSWWRLGETSGTDAFDEIGSNDGTYTNGPLLNQTGLITGDSDPCIRLDGTNDFVDLGDILNPGTQDFSVVIWINPDDLTDTNGHRAIQKRGTGAVGAQSGWQLATSTGWNNTLVDAGDGSYAKLNDTTYQGVTVGSVAMISLTWSNSNERLRFYVNDTLVETGTVTGTMSGKSISTTRHMTIGCSYNSGGALSQFFDGFEDDAVFWLGAELTATNISDLYAAGT
jgi:hypothetical protein